MATVVLLYASKSRIQLKPIMAPVKTSRRKSRLRMAVQFRGRPVTFRYRIRNTPPRIPRAKAMTSEGSGWFVGTVNAPAAYVMFHPTSTTGAVTQEPGQGEPGYYAAGEVWIQNKASTFNSKMIVSHIDLKTGQKLADDVVTEKTKTTSTTSYTTTPISGRTDVIAPMNASGNYQPGTFNVVYL